MIFWLFCEGFIERCVVSADNLEIIYFEVDVSFKKSPWKDMYFSGDVTVKKISKILLLKIAKAYNLVLQIANWFVLWGWIGDQELVTCKLWSDIMVIHWFIHSLIWKEFIKHLLYSQHRIKYWDVYD